MAHQLQVAIDTSLFGTFDTEAVFAMAREVLSKEVDFAKPEPAPGGRGVQFPFEDLPEGLSEAHLVVGDSNTYANVLGISMVLRQPAEQPYIADAVRIRSSADVTVWSQDDGSPVGFVLQTWSSPNYKKMVSEGFHLETANVNEGLFYQLDPKVPSKEKLIAYGLRDGESEHWEVPLLVEGTLWREVDRIQQFNRNLLNKHQQIEDQ